MIGKKSVRVWGGKVGFSYQRHNLYISGDPRSIWLFIATWGTALGSLLIAYKCRSYQDLIQILLQFVLNMQIAAIWIFSQQLHCISICLLVSMYDGHGHLRDIIHHHIFIITAIIRLTIITSIIRLTIITTSPSSPPSSDSPWHSGLFVLRDGKAEHAFGVAGVARTFVNNHRPGCGQDYWWWWWW